MFYSGFADEAAGDLDGQIFATLTLNWRHIECRNINGVNIHDLDDAAFDETISALNDSGIAISCFGSTIANWGVSPFDDEAFAETEKKLNRAIKRMHLAGCNLLRGMSFAVQRELSPDDELWERAVLGKVKRLVEICADNGIIYGHENCMNFGGQSYLHTLKLLDNIKMDNFRLIFDTGNPVFTDFRVGAKPYVKQSSWDFYQNVKEFISYVHIKDGRFKAERDAIFPEVDFCYPGEGDGDVHRIVKDLLLNGYDGGFSIEPHMKKVFHSSEEANKVDEIASMLEYLRYGVKFMKLFDELKSDIAISAE